MYEVPELGKDINQATPKPTSEESSSAVFGATIDEVEEAGSRSVGDGSSLLVSTCTVVVEVVLLAEGS